MEKLDGTDFLSRNEELERRKEARTNVEPTAHNPKNDVKPKATGKVAHADIDNRLEDEIRALHACNEVESSPSVDDDGGDNTPEIVADAKRCAHLT